MRARTVKPEFFRDKKMGQAGPLVALVFEALWCVADDFGTAPCDPVQLNGEMFVYWPMIGVPEIAGALRHLADTHRVRLFMVGDQLYARIRNWDKHQKPHKPSVFRHPIAGDDVAWDGDIPVPHPTGTPPAPPTSFSPVVLNPESSVAKIATTAGLVKNGERERTPEQRVVIAANQIYEKRFPHHTQPHTPGHAGTTDLIQALTADSIPIDFAERSVATQAGKVRVPASTMAYFLPGVRDAWARFNAKRDAASAPRVLALDRNGQPEQTRPPRGGSPPVPDDGVICRTCGTTETHVVNRRIVPKHKADCALDAATAQAAP